MTTLLRVDHLSQHFPVRGALFGPRRVVHALDEVDLSIEKGEALGLIGESGSGKTTLGRTILQIYPPTGGHIYFDGEDVTGARGTDLRSLRRRMQMVFQNPYSAVNRRKRIGDIIAEPLRVHQVGDARARAERTRELLDLVGLPAALLSRYPHEVSGGQLQRVGIARALALKPEFIIADEPTASLDVSIRAQVINLLADLRERLGLTLLFISHDLSIVSYLCERVAVMYLGKIVEVGPKVEVEQRPLHPYTRALLSAIPRPDPRQRRLQSAPLGEIPSAVTRPSGCHYHPRCPLVMSICRSVYPPLELKASERWVACHAIPALESARDN
jgi:oligopeptide/dipeptide ABC transporter ATP-binding protein